MSGKKLRGMELLQIGMVWFGIYIILTRIQKGFATIPVIYVNQGVKFISFLKDWEQEQNYIQIRKEVFG